MSIESAIAVDVFNHSNFDKDFRQLARIFARGRIRGVACLVIRSGLAWTTVVPSALSGRTPAVRKGTRDRRKSYKACLPWAWSPWSDSRDGDIVARRIEFPCQFLALAHANIFEAGEKPVVDGPARACQD